MLYRPCRHDQWVTAFEHYQQFPEYKIVHPEMTLQGFKRIYWVEYIHRVAGRFIAFFFLLPFLYFLVRGYLNRSMAVRLTFAFVLGGLQGLLGWYMVKSGLVDNPHVSQYRLTAHLSLAVFLYGYVLWHAFSFFNFSSGDNRSQLNSVRNGTIACIVLVALMLVSGGFMAGTHAGFVVNTFPDMNGEWVPEMVASLSPIWRNLFENVIAIQFLHRWIAVLTLIAILGLWALRFKVHANKTTRLVMDFVLVAALVQFSFGVSTLLSQVKLPIAMAHQSGFVLLLSVLILLLKLSQRAPNASINE